MGTAYTPEQCAEYMRLTLPLMTKYGVPATPRNYATWFKYAAGEDQALTDRIDTLKGTKGAFTDSINEELFHDYASECDTREFTRVRHDMVRLLREFSQYVTEAGRSVGNYQGDLNSAVEELEECDDVGGLGTLLRGLISKTQHIHSTTENMQLHFDERSAEIETLQKELERERKKAATDPLTGIPNRLALFDAIEQTLEAKEPPDSLSIVMIDIDHFKQFNDNFGHLIGDRVIKFVASLLVKHTRGGDTPARFGGEEFAVMLPNTKMDGALAVAENLRHAVADSNLVRADTKEPLGQITVSAGVAIYRSGEEVVEWIDRADQALYASKKAGRNRVTMETEANTAVASKVS